MKSKKISDSNKKNSKINWYLLIAVAIVVGAIIGFIATNSLSNRGLAAFSATDAKELGEVELLATSTPNYQSGIYNYPLELRLEPISDKTKGAITRYTLVNSEVENSESIKPDCKDSGSNYSNESISLSTEGKYFLSTITCLDGKPVSEVTTYVYSLEELSPSANSPINPDEPTEPEDPVTDGCGSGNGTPNNPIIICTAEQLSNIRNNLNSHYILGDDIDLGVAPYNTGAGWVAIGTNDNPFTGSLDGDGYTISNLYSFNQNLVSSLFGYTSDASFEDIILSDVNIFTENSSASSLVYYLSNGEITNCDASGYIYSAGNTGGLVGAMYDSEISNSSFSGNVESDSSVVGGLVGYSEDSEIEKSNATIIGTVHGMSIVGGLLGLATRTNIINSYSQDGYVYGEYDGCIGGLVGNSDPQSNIYNSHSNLDVYGDVGLGGLVGCMGNIYNSYSTGNVHSLGQGSNVYSIGGLAGAAGVISNSYARGNISVEGSADMVGGLVGLKAGPVTNSYSTGSITIAGSETNVGGLIGNSSNTSLVTSSYWDTQSSGRTTSVGGTGKTTTQMKEQSTFVGWDFTNIWDIDLGVNDGYPNLENLTANVAGVVETPTASASSGTYTTNQSVTLNSSTSGSTIYYTLSGENLTCGNGTTYTGAIPINSTTTLNAIACKAPSGNSIYIPSNILEAEYIIENTVATPTAAPAGGTYTSAQNVTLNTTTSGATIRYTINGTNPTCSTGTTYSSPITISENKTLKAIACKTGSSSEILSNTYVIEQATGEWEWAQKINIDNEIIISRAIADSSGNFYIIGRYAENNLQIGSFTLQLRDNQYKNGDSFVAKFDSQGNVLWVETIGGTWGESTTGIDLDNYGNIYVTGHFVSKTAYFGEGTSLSLTENNLKAKLFVAKLNNNGEWLWLQKAVPGSASSASIWSSDIVVDSQSNIYVTGAFQWQIQFPGLTFDYNGTGTYSPTLYSYGYTDCFLAKLDSTGNWLWARKAGGSKLDWSQTVAVDSLDNVYFAGAYGGTGNSTSNIITFGPFTFTRNQETQKTVIAKLDSAGNWLWVKTTTGMGSDNIIDMVIDNSNNLYAVGYFYHFQGSTGFGSTNLTSSGQSFDVFVSKLNSSGDWLWTKKAGGSGWESPQAIDVDSSNVYVTGNFKSGSATFGNTTLVNNIPSFDPNDHDDPNARAPAAFFAKLSTIDGSWISAEKATSIGTTASMGLDVSVIQNGQIYWFGQIASLETPAIDLGNGITVSCIDQNISCRYIAKKS